MSKYENNSKPFNGYILILLLIFLPSNLNAQTDDEISLARETLSNRGEVILRFSLPETVSSEELTRNLSIDNKMGDTLTAYANEKQFNWLIGQQISFSVMAPRSILKQPAHSKKSTVQTWDAYPSYAEYLEIMENFAKNYPGQCILKEFGTTVNGKKLIAIKISDNPGADETEPAFLYSSTIHGDEGCGYVLMLRLIDSLLTAYQGNSMIRQLIDNSEIWINPLANPDGFYAGADPLYFNSTRNNANHTDLNRNYPDPVAGDHPDGMEWQPETVAMMNFMKEQKFVLSANFHDGAEMVNYPWDCRFARHADDGWYRIISRQFADTVQQFSPEGFFSDMNHGITNGYDWYSIYGGRQDYVNHFLYGREVTIELTHVKSPDPSELPAYWDYYKKSLTGYMRHLHAGVHGIVMDASTGEPLKAIIEIPGHDKDSSQVFSAAVTGEFYRLLAAGDYTFRIASPGYYPQQTAFSLSAHETRKMTVSLLPLAMEFSCFPNPFTHTLHFIFADDSVNDLHLTLYDITGRVVFRDTQPGIHGSAGISGLEKLGKGIYVVAITLGSMKREIKVIKQGG